MLENKYPLFKKNEILEKEMLDLLRDNPMEMFNLLYGEYSDGILNGFNFRINMEERILILEPGILKFNKKFFWEKDEVHIPFPEKEENYIIKFRLECYSEEKKYYKRSGKILIEIGLEIENDELELARFIMREGAELRDNYENFEDFNREYNTIQTVHRKYSSKNKLGTLDPTIMKFWGMEALEYENLSMEDYVFSSACVGGLVEREIISSYINRKKRQLGKEYSNLELFIQLNEILLGLGERRRINEGAVYKPGKIMVD